MRTALDLRDTFTLQHLLGRPFHQLPSGYAATAFTGQRVLVTGAGGSVGSELVRQIAALQPAALMLVDSSEYALFKIEKEIRESHPEAAVEAVLGDVTRCRRMAAVFETFRPDAVFHAAAYKHVSMLERDVIAAVRANVFGSLNVARLSRRYKARLVLISSDKAANPRSVMGASKRLSELAVLAESGDASPIAIVRFGNVIASSGSVVELMLERIRRGLPIQVTDAEATRYFMSAHEAVTLVLQADRLGKTGDIFWLEMGEPIRILELAQRLKALAAEAGLPDVPVEFTGLRAGEKLREELTVQGIEMVGTDHPAIWIARQGSTETKLVSESLQTLRLAVASGDAASALEAMTAAVPEYEPSALARNAALATTAARSDLRKPDQLPVRSVRDMRAASRAACSRAV